MQKLLVHKQVPSPALVQRLGELVNRLDDKATTTIDAVRQNSNLDVCPEEYKGTKFGYPFYAEGWIVTNCTDAKPLRSVISVLINTVLYSNEDEKYIETVLRGITEVYPTIRVYLATRSNAVVKAAKKYKIVSAVKVVDTNVAKVWNILKNKASTPYVLVARDVIHFTWLTQLERQIRVVRQIPNVAVVGGAYRNLTGHWKAGCVQAKLKNYVLEYKEGYYHSKNGCMFCHNVQGPFVTKTNLLNLDGSLPNEVVFEDWFLRVVEDGNLIMSCPDAMYFTTDYTTYPKKTNKAVWTPLAKKWELNRVLLPQGVKHSFSCKDIGFSCSAHSALLPVCCQEEYAHALTFFQQFTDAHNMTFELDTGSVLGGVKFNGLLPWDLDGDFIMLSSDMTIFGKNETIEHFRNNGYSLSGYQPPKFDKEGNVGGGFVSVNFNGFYIEVWGMWDLTNTQYLPPELQQHATFTKANIRGNWIYTAFSPGLFVRNRYGREILRHSQSWMKVGLANSYADYNPGSFTSCDKPKHHACLHNFPADGDIPFLVD